jgi:hypothetical protein
MTKHLANEMVSEVMNPYLITVDRHSRPRGGTDDGKQDRWSAGAGCQA